MQTININDFVRIKLTPRGIDVLCQWLNEEFLSDPKYQLQEHHIDSDGCFRIQLWVMMRAFGQHIGLDRELCFDADITLESPASEGAK